VHLFLSCKACDIKTEALSEFSILRDRFGGKAAIVSTEICNAAARRRGLLSSPAGGIFEGEMYLKYARILLHFQLHFSIIVLT